MKAAAALLLAASAAQAWEGHKAADGQYQVWQYQPAQPFTVELVKPASTVPAIVISGLRVAIIRALETWQAVDSAHVPVLYFGQVADRAPSPGEVLLSLDTTSPFIGGHDTTGYTELTYEGDSIVAARVHLNFADFQWAVDGSPNAIDVQSVVEHEVGHALGLAHPCGDSDTNTPSCGALSPSELAAISDDVMYPSIAPGPRRALSSDDVAGISALLPALTPEPAPQLVAVAPVCLNIARPGETFVDDLKLTLGHPQSDLAVIELWQADGYQASYPLAIDGTGATVGLIPAAALIFPAHLDLRLTARSGKSSTLLDALDVKENCSGGGCSSGANAGALALLPLLWLLRRRKAALVLALSATPALAYVRTTTTNTPDGLCLWWSARGHSFQIDAQGTPDVPGLAAFTAIRKSFLTWSEITCSDLSFPDLGLSQDPKDRVVGYFPGQFNRNLVLFRTKRCTAVVPAGDPCLSPPYGCSNRYDCWDDNLHSPGVIATTTTTSNLFTGQIKDSDIELNDSVAADGSKNVFTAVDGDPCVDLNQTGCVRVDVQNTVTHEAGHSIGLAHSPNPQATMYASTTDGEVSKRVLGSDDVQAICDIYPKGARTLTCADDPIALTEAGSSNGGCGCTHAQTGPGAALGALALLLQMRRRSSKKPQLAIKASSAPAAASLPGHDIRS